MNTTSLRNALQSVDTVREHSFEILKSISSLIASPLSASLGQEMLLRALEQREGFGTYIPLLDSLVRAVGLFPYLSLDQLSLRDAIAYELHRPEKMGPEFVFHREQAEIYRRLMDGDNVILSAPTSFGKSRIIDALVAVEKFSNIVVVVPTLALIDETRRRLSTYSDKFKIVTHLSQEPSKRNIFVFTAERAVAYDKFPTVDFFVIDEFYKIDTTSEDQTRAVALNQAFYKLRRLGGQFYLLGPSVQSVPDGLQEAFRCYFYQTRFATVASDQIRVPSKGDEVERLVELCRTLREPTLVFCRSPARANEVARALIAANLDNPSNGANSASDWVSHNYHPEWVFGQSLKAGVGVHHGRLPRSLAQYVVRAFNEQRVRFLVCTSTLIEGVNTKAKNVVIFDNKIAKNQIDFFTFNNIQGRSGRMFEHFIGRVYLFNDPPNEQLPFVDFPLFTQSDSAPDSLLIQMEGEDLAPKSKDRVQRFLDQQVLPIDVLRSNTSIDPGVQVNVAQHIRNNVVELAPLLAWRGIPDTKELNAVCDLIWNYFVAQGRGRGGVFSARQLAFKIRQLSRVKDSAERVRQELRPGPFAAKTADEAVERVLEFERNWASFELPRYLMALSRIQQAVLDSLDLPYGDYSTLASQLECFFQTPVVAALDEYGIPLQVAMKLKPYLGTEVDLDQALIRIKNLQLDGLGLQEFEIEVLSDAKKALPKPLVL